MTITRHTPGPWKLEITNTGFRVIYSDSTLRSHIAALHEAALCEEHGDTFANARLIAAAPELRELVEQAYDRFTDNDFMPPNDKLSLWLEKAEAIFAATGEHSI